MSKTRYILIFLIFMSFDMSYGQSADSIKIGFMGKGLDAMAKSAVLHFLEDQTFATVDISDSSFDAQDILNQGMTHLWIYQMDKNDEQWRKKSVAKAVKKFVKRGGNLILSMEAVRLLNDWGIEKNSFEVKRDTIKDEGFGRPLGFHAFKSHPVFEGMHGGAYPWKAKEDHIIKKIGFFGSSLPDDTTRVRVIGTEWTYITFHEDNKLVLEYTMGKGKIIAVGAYTYFGRANYNIDELHRFYANAIRYTHEPDASSVPSHHWEYAPLMVQPLNDVSMDLGFVPARAEKLDLPKTSIQIVKEKAKDAPTILAGRRMMMIGNQKGGIEEIWTQPFMSFRDIRTGIVFKDTKDTLWLDQTDPKILVSPEMLVREYHFKSTVLKEVTTVAMEQPMGAIHYEWEGNDIDKIFVQYTTNFRYMWPYSHRVSGKIGYTWDSKANMAITTGQSRTLTGILSFSASPETALLGKFDGFHVVGGQTLGYKTDKHQISGFFSFDAGKLDGKIDLGFFAGDKGLTTTLSSYGKLNKSFESLVTETSDYYKGFAANKLGINTPDTLFNQGYQWALLRTDQFFQETPQIGTSMVAGLGSTARGWDGAQEVSGRPGYSWYFGRDAQWCAFAVDAYGGQKEVREILDVFEKFQALNGKILHELTTSGAVHYDASDATPLYVALAAHYLKYTGDVDYIRNKWPSLKRAMEFCYSTDTDGDGLIEITNVGHGWVEGGALFGTHTEVYLAGSWVAALESASYIAKALGKTNEAWFYQKDAERVKKKIDHSFWDMDKEYFYVGLEQDGSYRKEESVLTAVPIYFDAISDLDKAKKSAVRYAGNDYSTDWGVRILPKSSKSYNPRSYHAGMVWPLFGGWASLAEYKTGFYSSAFGHIMNNLLVYDDWNLGSVEETLNGDHYDPAGVCSQQGWSQTMVLQPIYEGMLGMDPDVLSNTMELAPRFPWDWEYADISNIPFGRDKISMSMVRDERQTTYHFESEDNGGISVLFKPAFPLGTNIEQVQINGELVDFTLEQGAESINLSMNFMLTGKERITIQHQGGIGVLPQVYNPSPGSENTGVKIIAQELFSDGTFKLTLEGQSNAPFTISLYSATDVQKPNEAISETKDKGVYKISGTLPKVTSPYATKSILIDTKID